MYDNLTFESKKKILCEQWFVAKNNQFLTLISLALPDNLGNTNNGRFGRKAKALVQSKSQITEHGEIG